MSVIVELNIYFPIQSNPIKSSSQKFIISSLLPSLTTQPIPTIAALLAADSKYFSLPAPKIPLICNPFQNSKRLFLSLFHVLTIPIPTSVRRRCWMPDKKRAKKHTLTAGGKFTFFCRITEERASYLLPVYSYPPTYMSKTPLTNVHPSYSTTHPYKSPYIPILERSSRPFGKSKYKADMRT